MQDMGPLKQRNLVSIQYKGALISITMQEPGRLYGSVELMSYELILTVAQVQNHCELLECGVRSLMFKLATEIKGRVFMVIGLK